MRRGLAWLGGALGLAALWRYLQREQHAPRPPGEPVSDPAADLRAKLDEARGAADDRDEFDAAEGQPVDQAEPREAASEPEPQEETEPEAETEVEPGAEAVETRSLEERRRAIHEKAQEALGEMQRPAE